VTLPVGKRDKVTVVPKDALVLEGATAKVFIVNKGSDPMTKKEFTKAQSVAVEIGAASFGNWIQVAGELKPGMSVVIRGNERLRHDQPLNIVREEK
jgi:multidrug efflux pump subunit AcrA (membrane-fusion protein)